MCLCHTSRLTAVAGLQTQQPRFSNRRSGNRERAQIAKTSAKQPAETISKGRGRSLGSQFCVHARRQWISNDVPANGRSARIYGKDRTHYSEISGGHRYRQLHPPNLRGTLHTTLDKHLHAAKKAGCPRFRNPLGALMPLVLTSDIAVEEHAPSQMELRERGLILIGPHRPGPRVRDGRYRSQSAESHYAASKIRALRVMARVTSMPTIPLVK